jgi:hypothetical protein
LLRDPIEYSTRRSPIIALAIGETPGDLSDLAPAVHENKTNISRPLYGRLLNRN